MLNCLRTFCLVLIGPLLFTACSTKKNTASQTPYEFGGMSLSKGIDKTGDTAVPREATATFSTDDTEAVSLLTFKNISGVHNVRWEWYQPDGELYYATENLPLATREGKFRKAITSWHRLTIGGDRAAQLPGQWKVTAYMNEDPVATAFFTLKLTDIENIGAAVKPRRQDWALVIGIEDYNGLPRVDFAKNDALLVKQYFHKLMGVPEENIILLVNRDATKSKIEGYLKQYLPANVSGDSTLYVYFAGHGAPDAAKGIPYLIPYDGDTRFLEQSSYGLKTFYDDLNRLRAQRVFLFMDSCFSGVGARSSEMLVKGTRLALSRVQNPGVPSEKIISLSATSEAQVSNSFDKQKHGLFTYYLLNGLRGAASTDKDKTVSVKELYGYVLDNVSKDARRKGTEQTPTLMPPVERVKDVAVRTVQQ